MKKIILIVTVVIGLIFLIIFIYNRLGSYWRCDKNGEWVKMGNPSYPSPEVGCGNWKPLAKNQADCLSQGGIWKKQGPEPFETCNRKAVDRGNLCGDNSECEGMCLVELTKEEMNQGMRGKINTSKKIGQCSVWVVELGCRGIMKEGKVQVICID